MSSNLCALPLHLYGWAESGLVWMALLQSLMAALGLFILVKQLQQEKKLK